MKIVEDRQKSYANRRMNELEFTIGDKVFLKVALIKGVLRFGKKGKLRPKFIGSFEILQRTLINWLFTLMSFNCAQHIPCVNAYKVCPLIRVMCSTISSLSYNRV